MDWRYAVEMDWWNLGEMMNCDTPNYYMVHVDAEEQYDGYSTIECDALIRALIRKNRVEGFDIFNYGNAIKYLFRFGEKGGKEDLVKAINYLVNMVEE